ncbi:cob(I)yrinic acid a,c-diamide adenosyltransferase [Pollutimonas sp. H1-120]|uniref:cob(I)yrinic acid a,c-diamide adenosyltransferase n=1 Tax=Pollutimonas sp. H1-120 TaxID=3148824 RepID=UPI003B52654A
MSTRLSVITTRTGDQGTTGLGDGSRIDKDAPRIAAMGDVDELNSTLGLLRSEALPPAIDALLARVQNDLFDLGAELCIPGHVAVKKEHVLFLEQALAEHNAGLGKLQEFILPGGTRAAALAHVARTVCRRAERSVIALDKAESAADTDAGNSPPAPAVNDPVKQYLNRLSDLCFVLARALNRAAGQSDVLWGR